MDERVKYFFIGAVFGTILYLLTSCGQQCTDVQVFEYEGAPRLFCQQHMKIWVEEDLVDSELQLVAEAAFYWNSVLDGPYFEQVAPQLESTEYFAGEIRVMYSPFVECGWAESYRIGDCTAAGNIYISTECMSYKSTWKETLYRHELGHILGLDHTSCDGQLMSPTLNTNRDDLPMDATEETIAKLKKLYHDKYGW